MSHTCGNCGATFDSKLDLSLHRDHCADDQLYCRRCGAKFAEAAATTDGWRYSCPQEDCDGEGIGEDLAPVNDVRLIVQ